MFCFCGGRRKDVRGKMENTYRMTDRDIRLMIQLRASNATIFTGRRNSAMRGWRAIRREMGFTGTSLSAQQMKKKWDNLKDKYRMLKNPPLGMENLTQPTSWRWFHLMDEAMTGRLAGTANVIQPSPLDEDERPNAAGESSSGPSAVDPRTLAGAGTLGDVLELSGVEVCGDMEPVSRSGSPADGGDGDQARSPKCEPTGVNRSQAAVLSPSASSSGHAVREDGEGDGKLDELQREWQALDREQAELDRELVALERNRELLDRDMATVDRDRAIVERDRASVERDRASVERDRASVERDRASVERDRLLLDRDRAFLDRDRALQERDRAFLERDRLFLDRAREDVERERALLRREREETAGDGRQAEITTEKEVVLHTRFYQNLRAADVDPEQLESRQRLVSLFQKLVEKL